MKKWNVYGLVQGTKYLGEVEAKTEEEARDKAWELDHGVHLCHQCANECNNAEVYEINVEENINGSL